jgi:8-amino-7-oxononanoate synthase
MTNWLDDELRALERAGLLRTRPTPWTASGPEVAAPDGRTLINLASNDYLSLAPVGPVETIVGSTASPLVTGRHATHERLESALSTWLGHDSATLLPSGYAANVALLTALGGPTTLIVSDALNHASIVDGCRLSRSRVVVAPHRDVGAIDAALANAPETRRLVVTDSYFSMDGDLAPLTELRAACDRHGALLLLDEAHALGVFGPRGAGCAAARSVRADAIVGTFGKSFGGGGAFIAARRALVDLVWNRGRSLVFSTALSPSLVAKALWSLPKLQDGVATQALEARVATFRAALAARGVAVLSASTGPIVPIVIGDPSAAVAIADRLREAGVLVHPMRPPTVPRGTSRLRCVVQAGHSPDRLDFAAGAIAECLR